MENDEVFHKAINIIDDWVQDLEKYCNEQQAIMEKIETQINKMRRIRKPKTLLVSQ